MKKFVSGLLVVCAMLVVLPVIVSQQDTSAQEAAEAVEADGYTHYTAQAGDSWWKLAHVTFRERALSSSEIENANPGKKLSPGTVLLVPMSSKDVPTLKPTVAAKAEKPFGYRLIRAEEGDTAFSLALKYYKDRSKFRDIIEANPSMPWADRLAGGEYILLPAVAAEKVESEVTATETQSATATSADGEIEVTVKVRQRLK